MAGIARVGLLGWPLGHSVSPAMHNAAFQALGLNWRYEALPCPPEELEQHVTRLLVEGYRGFNVTVPHKQAVITLPQVREVSRAVGEMGAANTLTVLPGGGLGATNTDWQGFADDLCASGIEVSGRDCLILGTGGSAQAVAYALRRMGAGQIAFVSRGARRCAPQKGRAGVVGYEDLGGAQHTVPLSSPPCTGEGRGGGVGARYISPSLVVNCTPVGMYPNADVSPWPPDAPFPPGAVLYDLVYNPPVTRLMGQARDAGARAIGGLGMLVRQGALSFEQWTGTEPPLDVMEQAAWAALAT